MFFRAPQSSTPAISLTARTLKSAQSKTLTSVAWSAGGASIPSVASQNWPCATSLATLAPMSTDTLWPSSSRRTSEQRPSRPPSSSSPPLMRLTDMEPGFGLPMLCTVLGTNWCGRTQTMTSASATAFLTSGSAQTFEGSWMPGRYLMFSLDSLKTSESFLLMPRCSTCSSNIHIVTSSWNSLCWAALLAMIFAMAHPQLPLPTTVTFFGPALISTECAWAGSRATEEAACDKISGIGAA
mmetsp:Transcript_24556/g.75869  ORF Transcript_24556/g.75869 Transcript_24556/m.75869 type:complete len:240 (+) Transcript_24556:714-1433(+)